MITKVLVFIAIIIISYLIGNISFARLLSKIKHSDITKLGSGNPGTMNMARNFGFKMGLVTLILDMLKALLPCIAAYFIGIYCFPDITLNIFIFTAGLSVILGHMFPVFYKFKGGKGIACALGVFAIPYPISLAIFIVIGIIVLLITKIGSLVSLVVVTGLTIISIIYSVSFVEIILVSIIYILLVLAHTQNIKRLLQGTENKLVFKKKVKKEEKKEMIEDNNDVNSGV